jgi:hypothetical protein
LNVAIFALWLTVSAVLAPMSESASKSPRIEVKTESSDGRTFSFLMYNRTYMGRQYHKSKREPDLHLLPTTYFHDKSPIGIVLRDPNRFPAKAEPPIAVLGMDVGTLAAYAKPGQTLHFTERVPKFVEFSLPAKGEKPKFTYVQDALDRGVKLKIFEGEPREMLEKYGPDKFYQVIVVETSKIPAIGLHKELMTKESLRMMMSKVTESGIVAYHTSNRHYDLVPVIASAVNELNLTCLVGKGDGFRDGPDSEFRFNSQWVMVARDKKYLANLKSDEKEELDWIAPSRRQYVGSKLIETKIDREFLWTDKGEQSLRGIYQSDPEIDKLNNALHDVNGFFVDTFGINEMRMWRATMPLFRAVRTWSAHSAELLNRDGPLSHAKKKRIPK